MNWQQRAGQIAVNLREQGQRSIREIAAATGMAKSSVHRQLQARQRRQQYPESPLWEQASGYEWLHRLVWAVVYVFGVKRGIGNDKKSQNFSIWFTSKGESAFQLMLSSGCGGKLKRRFCATETSNKLSWRHQESR